MGQLRATDICSVRGQRSEGRKSKVRVPACRLLLNSLRRDVVQDCLQLLGLLVSSVCMACGCLRPLPPPCVCVGGTRVLVGQAPP